MSDYSKTTNFTAKDSLSPGDSAKLIKGVDFDTEFNALVTAVNSKLDSTDYASQAEAEAETSTSKIISPGRLAQWADANDGMVGDIQALDIAADALLGWDQSAGAAIGFTLGDGLAFLTTTLHLEHLGIQDLEDAGADKILFWDDGAGKTDWLAATWGLEITATNLRIANVSAGANQPITFASGVPGIDLVGLASMEGNALAATDKFLVDDGGVAKHIEYQNAGFTVQTGQGTQPIAAADMNTIMEFNGTATLTIPKNTTTALPEGAAIIIVCDHATQEVTITAAADVVLNTLNHPGGGTAASDKVIAGGTAVLIKTETDEWYLSGDITN